MIYTSYTIAQASITKQTTNDPISQLYMSINTLSIQARLRNIVQTGKFSIISLRPFVVLSSCVNFTIEIFGMNYFPFRKNVNHPFSSLFIPRNTLILTQTSRFFHILIILRASSQSNIRSNIVKRIRIFMVYLKSYWNRSKLSYSNNSTHNNFLSSLFIPGQRSNILLAVGFKVFCKFRTNLSTPSPLQKIFQVARRALSPVALSKLNIRDSILSITLALRPPLMYSPVRNHSLPDYTLLSAMARGVFCKPLTLNS